MQRAHLDIKGGNLLLIGGRGQEIAHLGLEWVIHLHINVITGCLLLVIRVHAVGSTQEGKDEYIAVSIPPTWAKPTHTWGARNQTCCFSLDQSKGKLLLEEPSHCPLPTDLMTWLITMGSGCCSKPASFMGISENRRRPQLKI